MDDDGKNHWTPVNMPFAQSQHNLAVLLGLVITPTLALGLSPNPLLIPILLFQTLSLYRSYFVEYPLLTAASHHITLVPTPTIAYYYDIRGTLSHSGEAIVGVGWSAACLQGYPFWRLLWKG